MLGEFCKRVENDASAEGETDQGDGSNTEASVHEDVCEHLASRFCAVKGIRPWVVDEVAELG
jgi:hypothetical protein